MPARTGKRALIVDDSKSARVFLTRALEKNGLEVEAVENAEQAIEKLERSRPDVIFMDHLMPGMDGFQAVHSIRHNPRTATIPIMMYTSQEGELYLSQARALGAMGVLPKQVKHAELSSALFQLGLLPDRRALARNGSQLAAAAFASPGAGSAGVAGLAGALLVPQATDTDVLPVAGSTAQGEADGAQLSSNDTDDVPAQPSPALIAALRAEFKPLIDLSVRDASADLRRHLDSALEHHSNRWGDELRAALLPLQPAPPPPPIALEVPPERPPDTTVPWLLALAASIAAAVLGAMWWQEAENGRGLIAELADARGNLAARPQRPAPDASGAAAARGSAALASGVPSRSFVTPAARSLASSSDSAGESTDGLAISDRYVRSVPYGELPLAGERLEMLRTLTSDLLGRAFRGVVTVVAYPGRFCLAGNPAQGYAPAADETAFTRCDVVGNPFDEALLPGQRESLAVANLIGTVRQQSQGALRVELTTGTESERAEQYPAESAALTAGAWNRAAAANNRIEIRLSREPS